MKFEKKLILILKIVISSYRICYNKIRKKTEINSSDVAHDIGVKRKVILCWTYEAMFYAMETA